MADGLTARQRDIRDAAAAVLRREGADGLTVATLAAELGIKAPSLYKHFAGKAAIEAALMADALARLADALEAVEDRGLPALFGAYRAFALAEPELYRLTTDRPLPRELLPAGLEERAAAPFLRAAGGQDQARAAWAFAHGMVALELARRFPAGADLDAAWRHGATALATA